MRYVLCFGKAHGAEYLVTPLEAFPTRDALHAYVSGSRDQASILADPTLLFWVRDQHEQQWWLWDLLDGVPYWRRADPPPHRICNSPLGRRCLCHQCLQSKPRQLPLWVFLATA